MEDKEQLAGVQGVPLLKKGDLPTVEIVAKDKSGLLTPDNVAVFYNGLELKHLQNVSFNLDVNQPLATVTLTLLANVVVRTESETDELLNS